MNKIDLYRNLVKTNKSKLNEKTNRLDKLQYGLDVIGIADPTPVTDIANAAISVVRGIADPERRGEHLTNAGLRAVSAIPYVGDVAKAGTLGRKAAQVATSSVGRAATSSTGKAIAKKSGQIARDMTKSASERSSIQTALGQEEAETEEERQLPTEETPKETNDVLFKSTEEKDVRKKEPVNLKSPEATIVDVSLRDMPTWTGKITQGQYGKSLQPSQDRRRELPWQSSPMYAPETQFYQYGLADSFDPMLSESQQLKSLVSSKVSEYLKSKEGKKLKSHLDNLRLDMKNS